MQIGDIDVDTSELVTKQTLSDGGVYYLYQSNDAITEYPDGAMVVDKGDNRYYFDSNGDQVSSIDKIHVSVNGVGSTPKKDASWIWLVAALLALNMN